MKTGLLTLLLFSFCIHVPNRDSSTDLAETEILETVFRFQISHCYSDRSPHLYFVSYKGIDPSDTLMERLKDNAPSVRKRSQMAEFKDRDTGEVGVLLAIQNITKKNDLVYEVKATCGAAPLDARSYEYRIVQERGRWTVTRCKIMGVS